MPEMFQMDDIRTGSAWYAGCMSNVMADLNILIVDDAPNAARYAAYSLGKQFPRMNIETRNKVDIEGRFDVYIIDNDFEGRKIAAEMAGRVRVENPGALVIAFSATLDAETLKGLIRSGCDGVWDKADPADPVRVANVIREYLQLRQDSRRAPAFGLIKALASMAGLLREWNLRLNRLQQN